MSTSSNISKTTIKWMARYSGMVMAVLLLAFAINEGLKVDTLSNLSIVQYLLIASFSFIWVGYAMGWLSEKWGAILILGGWLAIYMISFIGIGRLLKGYFIVSLVFPGILYMVYLIKQKKQKD